MTSDILLYHFLILKVLLFFYVQPQMCKEINFSEFPSRAYRMQNLIIKFYKEFCLRSIFKEI